jgi:beta-glucanase (GH16 family)
MPLLRCLTLLCVVACGGSGGAQTPAPTPNPPSAQLSLPADHRLVWSDEFDTPGLPDAAKWSYDIGRNREGWFNNEKQYYGNGRIENSEVREGRLIITARKEQLTSASDFGGQAYTSARLLTQGKGDWTHGFFEVSAKLPCGQGTWPAIWMLGSTGDWPARGEMDILEHVGRDPGNVFSTVHTAAASGANGKGLNAALPDACNAFHKYQLLWTAQQLQFAVDGKVHFTYTNAGTGKAQWPFDAPQFMILNLAIGGDLGGAVDDTIFPRRMEVEYVRVYQRAP